MTSSNADRAGTGVPVCAEPTVTAIKASSAEATSQCVVKHFTNKVYQAFFY